MGFAPIDRAPLTFVNRTSGAMVPMAGAGNLTADKSYDRETSANATSVRVEGETEMAPLYKIVVTTPPPVAATLSPPTTPSSSPAGQDARGAGSAKAPGPGLGLALAALGVALLLRRRR
jgi:hypothetical protein